MPHLVLGALLLGALLVPVPPARAQNLSALYRVLHGGSSFRVRARAALVIGRSQQTAARPHLEQALEDSHASVRTAAAAALGALGDPAAMQALRARRRDRSSEVRTAVRRAIQTLERGQSSVSNTHERAAERATMSAMQRAELRPLTPPPSSSDVRWQRIRAVVILGEMGNRSGYSRAPLARRLSAEIGHQLVERSDIAYFARASDIDAAAQRQIRRRRIPQLRLQVHVQEMSREVREGRLALRCEVRLVLLDDPGNNLRGMLRGAASGTEDLGNMASDQEGRLAQRMVSVSVRSALGQLAQMVASAMR